MKRTTDPASLPFVHVPPIDDDHGEPESGEGHYKDGPPYGEMGDGVFNDGPAP
jgi:hypothetical protein